MSDPTTEYALHDVSPDDTRTELACGSTKMILMYLEEVYGREFVGKLAAKTRMNLAYILNAKNWVSMAFYYRFLDAVVTQTGKASIPFEAGAYAVKPDCFGSMAVLLLRLGTVGGTYSLYARLSHLFCRVANWTHSTIGPNACSLTLSFPKHKQDKNNCLAIQGALSALPELHGCPHAKVRHTQCACDGHPACVYEISWIEKPAQIRALVGAFLGLCVGGILVCTLPSSWSIRVLAYTMGLVGYLGGRVLDYATRLRESYEYAKQQSDSLEKSMKETETANATLQEQVEERTEDLKVANKEIRERRAYELAQQREATIGTLASGMAHELNTPLNTIQLGMQEIRKVVVDGGKYDALSNIYRATQRCSRIVGELLTFSREPQTVSVMPLHDVVKGALAVFDREKPQGIKVHYDLVGSVPPVNVDGAQIQQVLLNLLNNAVDSMNEQGDITVKLRKEGEQRVAVDVVDCGQGIPKEKQTQIFEPFESTKRRTGKGLGLGLSISAELTRKNGGTIGVTSEVGQGACFTIRFPIVDQEERNDKDLDVIEREMSVIVSDQDESFALPDPLVMSNQSNKPPTFSDNAINLLLVEDDKDAGQVLCRMLAEHDIRVEHVTSGHKGLETFDPSRFDAVVTDVFLGDMTGLDLLHAVREKDKLFPVILLTGHDSINSAIEALHYGAQDYIRKPLENIEDLSSPVRTAVKHHRVLRDKEILDKQLYVSEARFRSLAEMLPETVFEADTKGKVTFVNQAGMDRFGISPEMIQDGFYLPQGVKPEHADLAQSSLMKVVNGTAVIGLEIEAQQQSGNTFPILTSATPIWEDGFVTGIRAIAIDISRQKKVEQELRDYQDMLRAMDLELQTTEEKERCKLAQDLHDSVAQLLAAAKMQVGLCGNCRDLEELPSQLDNLNTIIQDALKQTRSLVFQLSPPSLFDLGLQTALKDLAEHLFPVYGIKVTFYECEDPLSLEEPIRIQVFRAVRELILNASKHAEVEECTVRVTQKGNTAFVTVEDNGCGFDRSAGIPKSDGGGFGLFALRERMKIVNGRLDIESEPGKGTKAIIAVPILSKNSETSD